MREQPLGPQATRRGFKRLGAMRAATRRPTPTARLQVGIADRGERDGDSGEQGQHDPDGAQVRDGAILDNRTGAPETRQPPRQRPRGLTSSVSGRAPTTFPLLKGENNPAATGQNLLQKNP